MERGGPPVPRLPFDPGPPPVYNTRMPRRRERRVAHAVRPAGGPSRHAHPDWGVVSLNLPGAGGLPTALGDAAAGTRSFFQTAGDRLGLGMSLTTRLSVDGALTGAEAIDCIAP